MYFYTLNELTKCIEMDASTAVLKGFELLIEEPIFDNAHTCDHSLQLGLSVD